MSSLIQEINHYRKEGLAKNLFQRHLKIIVTDKRFTRCCQKI